MKCFYCEENIKWRSWGICDNCKQDLLANPLEYRTLYDEQQGCCYYCENWHILDPPRDRWMLFPEYKANYRYERLHCFSCYKARACFRNKENMRLARDYLVRTQTEDNFVKRTQGNNERYIQYLTTCAESGRRKCSDCREVFVPEAKSYCAKCVKQHRLDLADVRKRRKQIIEDVFNECEICKVYYENTSKFCLDHNHITGSFRGVLCFPCNSGLGYAGDSVYRLEQLLQK